MEREEAIDVIRNIYQTDKEKEALETLIPELKESEDERVRKEIYNFLIDMECKKEWIAYLEKQKEQRPAEWSEEDEAKITFLERLIRYNVPDGQYGWVDGHKGGFVTKLEAISMLKSLRPSWKPSEGQMAMLKAVLKDNNNMKSTAANFALNSLYNDLEKLI